MEFFPNATSVYLFRTVAIINVILSFPLHSAVVLSKVRRFFIFAILAELHWNVKLRFVRVIILFDIDFGLDGCNTFFTFWREGGHSLFDGFDFFFWLLFFDLWSWFRLFFLDWSWGLDWCWWFLRLDLGLLLNYFLYLFHLFSLLFNLSLLDRHRFRCPLLIRIRATAGIAFRSHHDLLGFQEYQLLPF